MSATQTRKKGIFKKEGLLILALTWLTLSLACGPIAATPQPTTAVAVIPATNTPVTPTDTALPPTATNTPTITPVPPTETSTPPPTQSPSPTLVPPFVVVRLFPSHGDLRTQLAAETQNAVALGLKPFVEFEASW